jgi:carbon monoxide dehydrogenase subunit G
MKLEQSFDVDAPIDEVWTALTDVQRVAPCLPGAEITDAADDGTYHGNFTVKIGPTTAAYRGTLKMAELDEDGHVATMQADGQDKRGQGGAKATIVSRLTEHDRGGTHVDVETDMTITGRLARFGRGGMIQDVSNKLLGQFAQCLQTQLAGGNGAAGTSAAPEVAPGEAQEEEPSTNGASGQPPPAAEVREPVAPLDAGAVVLDVAKDRARQQAPLLAGAAAALLLFVLLRRRRAS